MHLEGNIDNNSIKTTRLNIIARFLKICPTNNPAVGDPVFPALRVEFYVCPPCEISTTTLTSTQTTHIITEVTNVPTTSPNKGMSLNKNVS